MKKMNCMCSQDLIRGIFGFLNEKLADYYIRYVDNKPCDTMAAGELEWIEDFIDQLEDARVALNYLSENEINSMSDLSFFEGKYGGKAVVDSVLEDFKASARCLDENVSK